MQLSNLPVSTLRHPRIWSAFGWGFVALIVYLSLMRPPAGLMPNAFNVGHLVAYAWLMLWFAQIHRPNGTRLVVGTLLCALGVAIEFAQEQTGYRSFEYADMLMNTLGVGLLLARTPLQNALRTVERIVAR
jgi:hypothetical protein